MSDDLQITQRTVEANGITFACDECGSGDDVALLLHGFPECRMSWRHQLVPLARLVPGMAQNRDAFPPDILARYRENALRPGAMTAMLNYYRANALAFVKSTPSEPVHVPTLMIWGEHDTALGLELTEGYAGLV